MSISKLRLMASVRVPAGPPPAVTLPDLAISANFFDVDTPPGTLLATLSPAPLEGEARAFDPPTDETDPVYFGVDGGIYAGSGSPLAGDYNIVQTMAGATNSPKTTPWTVTTYTPGIMPTVGVSAEWTTDDGDSGGTPPTVTAYDNLTKNDFCRIAVSYHEVITGDTLIGFVSERPVTVWAGGNSVDIPDFSWQMVEDPRTGTPTPTLARWCKLLKPPENSGTINVYATVPGEGDVQPTTVGPYPFYPRASEYDTLIKVAYDEDNPDVTPGYAGLTGFLEALKYKAAHPGETVWIELQDNPPIGWKFGEAVPGHINPTVWTKIYGKAGITAKIGDYTTPYLQPGIDGIWWGENIEWQLAAMGNGSQPYRSSDPGRIKLWGVRFSCNDPGVHDVDWSGSGSSALYQRRQPSGFAIYPSGSPTLTLIAGFCNIEDVPAFGLPSVHLALHNDVSDISGSCFENQFGAVLHNRVSRIGGRQSGLRGYNPAIRITANRTTYPYVAIEKTSANGNVVLGSPGEPLKLSVPLTIENAGAGYNDGVYDDSGGAFARLTVSGGSGTGALLVDATFVGGSLSKAYISKSTLMGIGYKTGDILTINQPGVTPTTPATIKLGSTFRIYGGANVSTAPVVAEMLLYDGMSHQDVVDLFNATPGFSAVSLNPEHDLDASYLIYDAQPAAGVPTASVIANGIPKRTWTGATFDLALGVDIHSNCTVCAYERHNIITMFNQFRDYAESAPISMGRASKAHWLVKWNEWYDSTSDEFASLSAQQGYWQTQTNHFVFEQNTLVSNNNTPGKGGGTYFGTLFSGDANDFRVRNNIIDTQVWSITKQSLNFYNNVYRLLTQTQADALAPDAANDGDTDGLSNLALSSVLTNAPAGDFTPLAMAQRADGSWAGARDGSGNYAGLPPLA